MAPQELTVLKSISEATPKYRTAPHNIEAEQALLGAILINNDAFYRVSDFLKPVHFFETVHQKIFDIAANLVRVGKTATPITLKTFLPPDLDIAGLSVSQYLARLAAEATTVINAEDYGRTIYDLAIRRDLIRIGDDMVNVAYEAPVEFSPQNQIEDAERRLYELAELGQYGSGFLRFIDAMTTAVDMAANAYRREGGLSGIATGLKLPSAIRVAVSVRNSYRTCSTGFHKPTVLPPGKREDWSWDWRWSGIWRNSMAAP